MIYINSIITIRVMSLEIYNDYYYFSLKNIYLQNKLHRNVDTVLESLSDEI